MTEPLTLSQLGHVMFKYWALILVGTILGANAGLGSTFLITEVYTATSTQLVKGRPGSGAAANYEAAQYAVSRAKSYPSFIYSNAVLDGVRKDLGGDADVIQLRSDLSATNPPDTPLLEISAMADTPEEARDKADLAAKYMSEFIEQIETVGGRSPVSVEIAVQAGLPESPTFPQRWLFTGLGGVLGFVLATLIALLRTSVLGRRSRPLAAGETQPPVWDDPVSPEERAARDQPPAASDQSTPSTPYARATPLTVNGVADQPEPRRVGEKTTEVRNRS